MPKKSDEKQQDETFRKKSDALNTARLHARVEGGPVRVDYVCAPSGDRCNFILCRLFNRHRLPNSVAGPHEIIGSRAEALNRMSTHISRMNHNVANHRVFVNVFYRVANTYTYNGRETQYVLIQFHPQGHPLLGENRHHFHIRPAWIENGQLQYNDTATQNLYNFTPADHYYYEIDDMNDYWFDEELSASCKDEEKPQHKDDKDDGSGSNRSRQRSRSKEKNKDRSSSNQNRNSSSNQGRGRSAERNAGSSNKCQCKWISAAGAATKYFVKKEGVVLATKQIAKQTSKATGKSFAKKIPFVGAVVGLGFGIARAVQGDGVGALGEITSGGLSLVPGVGTVASVCVDVGLAARDLSASSSNLICESCGKLKF